jgi:putative serine protease PepD
VIGVELRHLRYFLAVAEEHHFTRAAARLHVSQPPLSAQIRQLEQRLGATLFERSSGPVALTAAGEALVEPAYAALAALDAGVEAVRASRRGTRWPSCPRDSCTSTAPACRPPRSPTRGPRRSSSPRPTRRRPWRRRTSTRSGPLRRDYDSRRSGKTRLRADDGGTGAGQHRGMIDLRTRGRALAATASMLVGLAALAGCGGDESTSSDAGIPESGGAAAVQRQFVKLVDHVSPQVVQIETNQRLGSGIVYDDKGDIVTNAHVAGNSRRFLVTLAGGDRHTGTLVGTDPSNDLAVIHVSGANPSPASFDDSSGVQSGDIVFAIGNPLGLQSSVTQGIVSSLNRNVSEGNGVTLSNVIQTSAEINPGNSGGALVDLSGRVVGVPTLAALDPEFGDTPAAGIGFAIPSNTVRRVADRLIASNQ